jgi:hypothetical protein
MVDRAKVVVILIVPPPTITKQLRSNLSHTGYYRRLIRSYASIIAPLEQLLKKYEVFS